MPQLSPDFTTRHDRAVNIGVSLTGMDRSQHIDQ
jgi:hypothetical protein